MQVLKSSSMHVEVPAGRYFLGDPCYAVRDEDWDDLLQSCDYFQSGPVGTLKNGVKVLGFNTRWGDGVYRDGFGNQFPVDAGMIGLTPVEAFGDADEVGDGLIVEFKVPTLCTSEGHGATLTFGKHVIHTAGDDDYDYDDE